MGLMEALKKEYCFYPLEGTTKEEILSDLVSKFSAAYGFDEQKEKEVLNAVLKREALCSTGLEDGVAIPHAKLGFIKNAVVSLAVSAEPIDFGSTDGSRTSVFFLVLGSEENPSEHVQVLSQIAKLTRNTSILNMIKRTRSSEELGSLLFN